MKSGFVKNDSLTKSMLNYFMNYDTYFMKIDNVKFKRKVIPGDTVVFELKLLSPIRRGLVHMRGKGYVNGEICIEAEMLAHVTKDREEE